MRLARNLRLSVRALAVHPVRTALAMASAAVGVAGVLLLTAVATGARAAVVERIELLGRDLLVVNAGKHVSRGGRALEGEGWVNTLRPADAEAIRRGSPHVLLAAPVQEQGMTARFGPVSSPAKILGTTPAWAAIRRYPLSAGRFFTDAENASRSRVAVLGADAQRSLFPDSINPLGKMIRIGRVPFRVVGVLEAKGISVDGAATEDDRIVVPIETALLRVFNLDYLKAVYIQAAGSGVMDAASDDAAAILRIRHDLPVDARDDFVIQNQRVVLEAALAAQATFRRTLLGLGLLALLAGGVGIQAIMRFSLRERRPEIFIRVACGARRSDLRAQFLAESLMLCLVGGAVGLLLGLGAAELVSAVTRWEASVTPGVMAVAVGSAVVMGVGTGGRTVDG